MCAPGRRAVSYLSPALRCCSHWRLWNGGCRGNIESHTQQQECRQQLIRITTSFFLMDIRQYRCIVPTCLNIMCVWCSTCSRCALIRESLISRGLPSLSSGAALFYARVEVLYSLRDGCLGRLIRQQLGQIQGTLKRLQSSLQITTLTWKTRNKLVNVYVYINSTHETSL